MTNKQRKDLPNPHHSYERADPQAESGMGDLDRAESTPTNRPDSHQHASEHRPGGKNTSPASPTPSKPSRNIENIEDDELDGSISDGPPHDAPLPNAEIEVGIGQEPNTPREQEQIEGSMNTEPPLGEDLMPTDIHDPQQKRHPRPDGKGGSERETAFKRSRRA